MHQKIVMIQQPQLFPPLYLVQRALCSDVLVIMDYAQVNRKVGMTSAKFAHNGTIQEMRLPLTGGNRALCTDAKISDAESWRTKTLRQLNHWVKDKRTIVQAEVVIDIIVDHQVHDDGPMSFSDAGWWMWDHVFRAIGRKGFHVPELVQEKEIISKEVAMKLDSTMHVLELARKVNATGYICGKPEDRPYLSEKLFDACGIEVIAQNYYPENVNAWLSWISVVNMFGELDWVLECFGNTSGVSTKQGFVNALRMIG